MNPQGTVKAKAWDILRAGQCIINNSINQGGWCLTGHGICVNAAELAGIPSGSELSASGVQEAEGDYGDSEQHLGSVNRHPKAGEASLSIQAAGNVYGVPNALPMEYVGPELPPLPKRIVGKIKSEQYIDFTELPPAKGKGRSLTQPTEGQIIVVQAADLVQNRKTIPDYATWSQCYALYVAVSASHRPNLLGDLRGYQSLIARVSKKYKRPAWVIYDQNFRQEAAGNPDQPWVKADPSPLHPMFYGPGTSE